MPPLGRGLFVFEDDKLVLFFVVTELLIRGEYGKGDVVSLDDFGHELVVILGIAVIGGVVKIHGVLDRQDGRLADDRNVRVALDGDVVFFDDLGRRDLSTPFLKLIGRVANVGSSSADDRPGLVRGWLRLCVSPGIIVAADGDSGLIEGPGLRFRCDMPRFFLAARH